MAKNNNNVKIMITDYCSMHSIMNNSYTVNTANNSL